ncbi:histidine biosynthesis bifunctional protein hisB [Zygosaccharomyces mellis]|uniref:Imidazole glycerol phosphate synthase hisHF n=1 Tax=Zygosaccharomyces mellis TaxID=42258 RepID=A0A4C2EER9_9SACH|nr:histidine biosynthesis bifunctional protein hisB [Zygosaccharomyces mellis]
MSVVHIIDVESGNLQSLINAIEHLGFKAYLVKKSDDPELANASKIILPGVGNFGHFLDNLFSRGFEKPIREFIASGKPIMGVCVGLQALFNTSEESPQSLGFNYINFDLSKFGANEKPVPEIGWNSCTPDSDSFFGLDPYKRYYFVHSYAAILTPQSEKVLIANNWKYAKAKYGTEEFIAAVNKDNIFATQFHPEKSGLAGLHVIENFLKQQHPVTTYSKQQMETLSNDYSNFGLTRRIIACLDVRTNNRGDLVVTKGDQYDVREKSQENDVRNLGKPVELAQKYYEQGADEVTFLNITSFRDCPLKDTPMLEVLRLAAKTVFVPLTVGGGIKDIVDVDGTKIPALEVASLYFRSGADKVSIGTDSVYAAEKYYELGGRGDGTSPIETISKAYGAQAVVISVDPKRVYVDGPQDTKNKTFQSKFPNEKGQTWCWYACTIKGGRETKDIGVWELTKACEALGAGEVLLNCIDKDGSNTGYDLELLDHAKDAVKIPVIASSGAGNPGHFEEAFTNTRADACLGAGMFHRGEYTVNDVKEHLLKKGLKVRMDRG